VEHDVTASDPSGNSETALVETAVPRRLWVVSHELPDNGQTVVFDESRSELLMLNGTGGAVWESIDGKRDVAAIVDFLAERLEQAPSRQELIETTRAFLLSMAARGALEF